MSCKSALYAINNSAVSLPDGGTYAPATIVRRYGQNYQLQGKEGWREITDGHGGRNGHHTEDGATLGERRI